MTEKKIDKKVNEAQEALKEQIEKRFGEEVYIPFQGDVAKIDGRTSEIEVSNIPKVSVEMEMEDFLRTVDSVYRQQRRKILQLVIRQPELMEPIVKTVEKGWTYMKKLFSNYNI